MRVIRGMWGGEKRDVEWREKEAWGRGTKGNDTGNSGPRVLLCTHHLTGLPQTSGGKRKPSWKQPTEQDELYLEIKLFLAQSAIPCV